MIPKIQKGTNFEDIGGYHQHKEDLQKGRLIGTSEDLQGYTLAEIIRQFNLQAEQYKQTHAKEPGRKLERSTFHPSVSFAWDEELTDKKMIEIAREYLNGMKYENCDFAVVHHTDKKHPHFHIITSRISNDGLLVRDSFERVRSRKLARKIEA